MASTFETFVKGFMHAELGDDFFHRHLKDMSDGELQLVKRAREDASARWWELTKETVANTSLAQLDGLLYHVDLDNVTVEIALEPQPVLGVNGEDEVLIGAAQVGALVGWDPDDML